MRVEKYPKTDAKILSLCSLRQERGEVAMPAIGDWVLNEQLPVITQYS